jgi:hypothetical protein
MDLITLIVIIIVLGCCIYWAPMLSPPGAPPIVAWGIRAIFIVIALCILLGFIGYGPGHLAFDHFDHRSFRR